MGIKSKKIRLEEKDDDFELLAIASSEDDYHLAWLINQALNINLCRNEHSHSDISSFVYNDEQQKCEYVLINNTTELKKIAPEFSTVDFLLKISGKMAISDIAKNIRNVKEVTACIVANVKNKPLYAVFSRI